MVQIDITRMSSKGQVVIPAEMREDVKEGEKLLIIKNNGQIILKKATLLDKTLEKDLEFARRTEEAWKEIESGKCKTIEFEDFISKIKNG